MPAITLEAIDAKQTELDAKQTELSKLIAQFKEQINLPIVHIFPKVEIELQPGEHYAGPALDEAGHMLYHLVLMAELPSKKLNWEAAVEWAHNISAALPDRQDMALLFANCKPHLKPEWHWSCETYAEDASYAWHCYFYSGRQCGHRKSYEGGVVAVRRIYLND